ncbi:MAG TPA: glycosyltransferase [Terriglobales bacterium]|nr:glycosyltransferase [Terriglobales bacterium]
MKPLRIHLFAHSLVSDWSHGSAHFLRGLARALMQMGHKVRCHEELGSWSLVNLVRNEQERSIDAIDQFRSQFRELDIHFYERKDGLRDYLKSELRNADIVIIHEWNEPQAVNAVLSLKEELKFRALFLDTHHRAYTRAGEMLKFHLHLCDGVLAAGEPIRKIYTDGFGVRRAWTFHEAADVDHFFPLNAHRKTDVVWIGNWGDESRTAEMEEFLVRPASELPDVKFQAYGVRYPAEAIDWMLDAGVDYRGYLPNLDAPQVYAEAALALHLPRKQYTNGLAGVPATRVFEALACGATLLSAPWEDLEHLFRPEDFVRLKNGEDAQAAMTDLLRDDRARRQIAENGLETIRARHTCRHRAEQLTGICQEVLAQAD